MMIEVEGDGESGYEGRRRSRRELCFSPVFRWTPFTSTSPATLEIKCGANLAKCSNRDPFPITNDFFSFAAESTSH
jgi:hypothetical protein